MTVAAKKWVMEIGDSVMIDEKHLNKEVSMSTCCLVGRGQLGYFFFGMFSYVYKQQAMRKFENLSNTESNLTGRSFVCSSFHSLTQIKMMQEKIRTKVVYYHFYQLTLESCILHFTYAVESYFELLNVTLKIGCLEPINS